jgi:hypothetical protein
MLNTNNRYILPAKRIKHNNSKNVDNFPVYKSTNPINVTPNIPESSQWSKKIVIRDDINNNKESENDTLDNNIAVKDDYIDIQLITLIDELEDSRIKLRDIEYRRWIKFYRPHLNNMYNMIDGIDLSFNEFCSYIFLNTNLSFDRKQARYVRPLI